MPPLPTSPWEALTGEGVIRGTVEFVGTVHSLGKLTGSFKKGACPSSTDCTYEDGTLDISWPYLLVRVSLDKIVQPHDYITKTKPIPEVIDFVITRGVCPSLVDATGQVTADGVSAAFGGNYANCSATSSTVILQQYVTDRPLNLKVGDSAYFGIHAGCPGNLPKDATCYSSANHVLVVDKQTGLIPLEEVIEKGSGPMSISPETLEAGFTDNTATWPWTHE